MKNISIVELQRNPGKALEEVPVLITKHGKKWRMVTGVNVDSSTYNTSVIKPIKTADGTKFETLEQAGRRIERSALGKKVLCEHGAMKGLCKHGCK